MKTRNQRSIAICALAVALIATTVAYAVLQTTLNISVSVTRKGGSWNIHFENVANIVKGGSATLTTPTISNAGASLTFSASLAVPKDSISFTVNVVNDGTIDAMLSSITLTGQSEAQANDVTYTVTYADGTPINVNDELKAKQTKSIKVTVAYDDVDSVSAEEVKLDLGLTLIYKQADSASGETGDEPPYGPEAGSFATDSWATIAANVRSGNTDVYESNLRNNENNTKKVELTIDGSKKEYTVRIANTTTPDECQEDGFSQTACGFVVEFVDIIAKHEMNPTNTTKGGYPASSMYKFLNDETDSTITSIYELLPEEIKNVITPTFVVSGYGSEDTSKFESTDKLYLLSLQEVYGNITTENDKAAGETRQLDHYEHQWLTSASGSEIFDYKTVIKKLNGTAEYWWLRSAYSRYTGTFSGVSDNGAWRPGYAGNAKGVAPAFRIG